MGENLTRAENYLSLVGLVVLILGGIGVSSVTRVFVQQKLRSIAILKCVGATSREILAIYMTQVLLLGVAGSCSAWPWPRPSSPRCPRSSATSRRLPGRVRLDDDGGRAGPRRRSARVGAVFARAAARRAAREAVAAAASRHPTAGRIDWVKWSVTGVVAASLVALPHGRRARCASG
jgi:putative ABC transport system permease protein